MKTRLLFVALILIGVSCSQSRYGHLTRRVKVHPTVAALEQSTLQTEQNTARLARHGAHFTDQSFQEAPKRLNIPLLPLDLTQSISTSEVRQEFRKVQLHRPLDKVQSEGKAPHETQDYANAAGIFFMLLLTGLLIAILIKFWPAGFLSGFGCGGTALIIGGLVVIAVFFALVGIIAAGG